MTIELNETHKNMRIHSVGVLKCMDSIVKFIYIFPNRVHIYKLTDQLRWVFMKGPEFKLEVDERTLAARKVTQFLKIKIEYRIKFEPVTFFKFFLLLFSFSLDLFFYSVVRQCSDAFHLRYCKSNQESITISISFNLWNFYAMIFWNYKTFTEKHIRKISGSKFVSSSEQLAIFFWVELTRVTFYFAYFLLESIIIICRS